MFAKFVKFQKFQFENLVDFEKCCKTHILNYYFLAKIGADTAENEQHFEEILPKTGNYPTGPDTRYGFRREAGALPRPGARRAALRGPQRLGDSAARVEPSAAIDTADLRRVVDSGER